MTNISYRHCPSNKDPLDLPLVVRALFSVLSFFAASSLQMHSLSPTKTQSTIPHSQVTPSVTSKTLVATHVVMHCWFAENMLYVHLWIHLYYCPVPFPLGSSSPNSIATIMPWVILPVVVVAVLVVILVILMFIL